MCFTDTLTSAHSLWLNGLDFLVKARKEMTYVTWNNKKKNASKCREKNMANCALFQLRDAAVFRESTNAFDVR